MKQLFLTLAIASLTACGHNDKDCCESTVKIMGVQQDYTQDTFVPDSVFHNNIAIIDSLKTVSELLNHLETLPSKN
jgi:outer membrane lipopolysaccharide assembly protein LptE/RlpB|tara:strand:+ start:114 stop:341 length:228 start_codon:yes stop_codon:yes gene_type:complete